MSHADIEMTMATRAPRPPGRGGEMRMLGAEGIEALISGGAVLGPECALDGLTRGLKVGPLQARDDAAETSRRSSTPISGALGYLEQLAVCLPCPQAAAAQVPDVLAAILAGEQADTGRQIERYRLPAMAERGAPEQLEHNAADPARLGAPDIPLGAASAAGGQGPPPR